jgi:integrase
MPQFRPVPFARLRREVLQLYRSPSRRSTTRAKIRQVLDEFTPLCRSSSDLDPGAISDWLALHPERTAATHRSLLSSLRAICRYGRWKGYMANPFEFRPFNEWLPADEVEQAEEFSRHRTADEIRRVLRRADKEAKGRDWQALRLRAAVYCWAFTGAGSREILGLRLADVDLERRIIAVRSHHRRRLKTGARAARLAIPRRSLPVLVDWVARVRPTGSDWLFPHLYLSGPWLHGPRGRKALDQVRQLGERAGVAGLTILAFRHTVGTLSEGWRIGELGLQRLLRHSLRKTQRAYRHHDAAQLHGEAAKIRY